jgi:hypothetical protein
MARTEREFGKAGLAEAMDRLRDRLNDPSSGDPIISLAEALHWCYALQELQIDLMGRPAFQRLRDGSLDGKIHAGLMYARKLSTHDLVETAQLVSLPAPMVRRGFTGRRGGGVIHTASAPYSRFHWKPLAGLPVPSQPSGRSKYEAHVAGQPVLPPMEAAEQFLTRLP